MQWELLSIWGPAKDKEEWGAAAIYIPNFLLRFILVGITFPQLSRALVLFENLLERCGQSGDQPQTEKNEELQLFIYLMSSYFFIHIS